MASTGRSSGRCFGRRDRHDGGGEQGANEGNDEELRAGLSPIQTITVNLAPADIKKEGSGFDLAMAIGILGANGTLLKNDLNDCLFLGELSLDGSLRTIKGALSTAVAARQKGVRNLVLPQDNAREASVVKGINRPVPDKFKF